MRFVFPFSHTYPSGRLTVEDDGTPPPHCVIVFGDGLTVSGRWQHSPEGIELAIPGHTTATGLSIPARDWLVTDEGDGKWIARKSS